MEDLNIWGKPEIVTFDSNIPNRIWKEESSDHKTLLLQEALAGKIICVSPYMINELDATSDYSLRRQLIQTVDRIITKAKEVRVFLTWPAALAKEHNDFVAGKLPTIYTVTEPISDALFNFIKNPEDTDLQEQHHAKLDRRRGK